MMARTQITLEPETHSQARQRAHELGISLAEYIRQLVTRDLDRTSPKKVSVERIFNLGRSSAPTNIARDKDAMIAEAIGAARPQRSRRRA